MTRVWVCRGEALPCTIWWFNGRSVMAEASAKADKSAENDALIGRVINDRFRVDSVIARGGMGKVYKAEQVPLGRKIALKILDPKYTGDEDPEFHTRFFLEASTAAKLNHPNTVTVFDYGRTEDDVFFIAMELVEGKTLAKVIRESTAVPIGRALNIAMQICRSLREAHGIGVVHRDLKPANVLITRHADEEDFVKVLDFGLVKNVAGADDGLTQAGMFMGSPKYMSPEQISGGDLDGRTDVYSLGVMLYQMVTGRVPFDRPNQVQTLMAHVRDPIPPMNEDGGPAIPPVLEHLVHKCLAKKKEDRFESMNHLLNALKEVASGEGMSVQHSGSMNLTGEFSVSGLRTAQNLTPSGPYGGADVLHSQSGENSLSGSHSFSLMGQSGAPSVFPPSGQHQTGGAGGRIAIAAGLIIAMAGGGAFLAMNSGTSEDVQAPAATAAAPVPVAPAPEPEPAEPAEPQYSVNLTFRSVPPGATVFVGEEVYGPTPASVQWVGDRAKPGTEYTFRFEADGYDSQEVTKSVVEGEDLDITLRLTKEETEAPTRVTRTIRRKSSSSSGDKKDDERSAEPVRVPGNYLDSPY